RAVSAVGRAPASAGLYPVGWRAPDALDRARAFGASAAAAARRAVTGAGEPGADPDHGPHQGTGPGAEAHRGTDRAERAQRAVRRRRCGGALAGAGGRARPGAPARLRRGPAPCLPRVLTRVIEHATLRRP